MACPSCGSALRPGAKFCDQCGTSATGGCTSCGAELRPGAKFCDTCGANQVGTASALPTPALPEPAQTAQPEPPLPEQTRVIQRKVTSVLFGDLVAFTTFSERHDKEDVRDLLSRYFERCRLIVSRYGGTIEKFIGDAVMAVWGVPTAHEDDAERAVRAGLELVRAVEALGEELGLPTLEMRVGIVTGEVAVTVGAEHEGMVAGDAVNTAARVQSVASEGEVWVDETTRLLTSGAITYLEVGSHQLKGKADPVPLWAVRAVVAALGGAQRADGLEASLTGRGRELRVIKELFHGVEEGGRPVLVVVDGDPGLGKSRLAWEFEKYIDGLSSVVAWHSTRCLAYGDGVPFWPIAEAVRGRLGLIETDQGADPDVTLDEWLAANVPDGSEAAWLRARVLALVGAMPSTSYDREDLFAAWQTFFERAGQGGPVALVIDDAQHIDDGTVSFLEHLMVNSETPLFLMLMSRRDLLRRRPDLATNRRSTVLHLAGLDDRDMAALLDGLVTGLPPDLRDGLVERAQGVPLYAIETVRSLIDRDLVVPRDGVYVLAGPALLDLAAIGAPASLHALVAARLDSLPPEQRRVVADASVLGARFTREAIEALVSDVRDLPEVLNALTRAEILGTVTSRLSADYGQYRFVQDVVRQVAYSTLSRRDRKARHLGAAGYFETLPDSTGDYPPIIAQHYLDAIETSAQTDADLPDLRERVVDHLLAAAARARAVGAPIDALHHLDLALANAGNEATAAGLHLEAAWAALDALEADLVETHATAATGFFQTAQDAIGLGGAAAALAMNFTLIRADNAAAIDTALPHWKALQGVRGAEPVLLALGKPLALALTSLNQDATDILLARIALAESIADRVALADALNHLGVVQGNRPAFTGVLLRGAAEIAREQQRPSLLAKILMNLSAIGWVNDLAQSRLLLGEAAEESRKVGMLYIQNAIGVNQVMLELAEGDWDRAEELIATVPSRSPQMHLALPWIDGMLALAKARPRRIPPPPAQLRDTDDGTLLGDIAGADMYDAWEKGDLGAAAAKAVEWFSRQMEANGLFDDATHIWPAAVDCVLAAGDDTSLSELLAALDDQPPALVGLGLRAHRLRFAALVAIRDGASCDVEQPFRAAISAFEQWGSRVHAARTRAELAGWLDTQGRTEEAAALRPGALAVLHAVRANGWLAQLGFPPATEPVSTPVGNPVDHPVSNPVGKVTAVL